MPLAWPSSRSRELVDRRHDRQHVPRDVARLHHRPRRQHARQVAVHRADGRRDRHVVVVQDHQQVDVRRDAGIVERLEGHAGAHRAVADDGDMPAPVGPLAFAEVARGHRHAERSRYRSRRVRRAEGVVLALAAPRKAGDPFVLPKLLHLPAPAGEDLVRIGLVPDVPHQAVVRRVEDVVQRDGQLDRAEVRRQVAAGARDRIERRRRATRRTSFLSAARSSRRRSAGLLMVSSNAEGAIVISGPTNSRCPGGSVGLAVLPCSGQLMRSTT